MQLKNIVIGNAGAGGSKMLAIITGTIRPDKQVGKLVIKNETVRLQQYKDALSYMIRSKAFSKIVFCENSDYGITCFAEEEKEAVKQGVGLELLSFRGSVSEVLRHGKGYGEGEIMDYVFANSKLVTDEPYFVKVTGRLKIVNISDICHRINPEICYFNIPNRTIRDFYDTKIYAMPVSIFKKHFRKVYDLVWDEKGIYLERVYTKILSEQKLKVKNFPRYPRVIGTSGSTGLEYGFTEWKCKIRDIISIFEGYKVNEK